MELSVSLEKLVQKSSKVEVEPLHYEVYKCPLDFNSKVFRKYVWVIHGIHSDLPTNWIQINVPGCGFHTVSLKQTGSTVAISGRWTDAAGHEMICSKIQVVGREWMKMSAWLNIDKLGQDVYHNFGLPSGYNLDSILCPTMLIPTFKIQNSVLESVIVLAIEFAYKNDIDKIIKIGDAVIVPKEHGLLSNQKLYNEKIFADVIIDVKPENDEESQREEILVHKSILAARSKVFEAMLTLEMKENKFCKIEIVDFKPIVVHEFLKYLYIGETNLEEKAVELLKLSNKYDVPELLELCQKYIAKNIVKIGWEAIFQLIDTYEGRVPVLMDMVQDYYKRNETLLRSSSDFQACIALFPELFIKLTE